MTNLRKQVAALPRRKCTIDPILGPNPSGECQCGCGEKTTIAAQTHRKYGWVKGTPLRFAFNHAARVIRRETTPLKKRFWDKVDKTPGHGPKGECWVWTACTSWCGYGMITGEGGVRHYAHRLSFEWRKGSIPEGMQALHKCDNPPCVRPGHLFLGDGDANMKDRNRKGRQAHGESHARARLTDKGVITIRKLYRHGVSNVELAKRFGVSTTAIINAGTGRTWRHLPC
jgi:hypothetical protein